MWINRLGEDRDESICGAVQPDLGDLLATVERVRGRRDLTASGAGGSSPSVETAGTQEEVGQLPTLPARSVEPAEDLVLRGQVAPR